MGSQSVLLGDTIVKNNDIDESYANQKDKITNLWLIVKYHVNHLSTLTHNRRTALASSDDWRCGI